MKAERYLSQYLILKTRADNYKARIAEAENVLRSIEMDGQPKGTKPGDPTQNAALRILMLKESYAMAIADAEETCAEITATLERMSNSKYKRLLYMRYIEDKPWSQVSKELDVYRPGKEYEIKSVMGYMKRKALKELQEVLNER